MDNASGAADALVQPAIDLVSTWVGRSELLQSRTERATMATLRDLVLDDGGVEFVMRFVDRVARPDDDRVAATQLAHLVQSRQAQLRRAD